ncbi:MAG TPA: LptF/LptG family permease [Gemmatimonadales bacterium]|jgi:lipopolysaccharide export system permease protein|nr:LptF/LptG family permease [Gemmatimonadales bacterium]
MRLLERYLLRQLVAPFFFALAALTSIMLLNQIARRFGALVGKGLPWSVIAEVFGLSIPFILAITLPMAVLMAVLYCFTHLAADNEITAMKASGISVYQVVAPVFAASVFVAFLTFLFTDQVLPRSNAHLRSLMFNIARKKPTFELREQVINELGPAGIFIRALRIDPSTGRMRDVTLYDMAATGGRRIIYADSGIMALMANETDLSLRLFSGSVHQFKATDRTVFQLTFFRVNDIRVRDITNQFQTDLVDAQRGDREMSTCEMLKVIRGQEREVHQAEVERRNLVLRDLRSLLGLPPPRPPDQVTEEPVGGYCRWAAQVQALLLPKTAEAQEPTQGERKKQFIMDSIAASRGRAPLAVPRPITARAPQAPVPGEPAAAEPDIHLTNWGEVLTVARQVDEAQIEADKYSIEVHKKWSISVACIVFVLVGVPMALRFPRGGMGLVLGGGLAVFSVYYIGLIAGEALGDRAIVNPVWAMWASNFLFAGLGLLGLYRVSQQSGSSRGGDFAEILDSIVGRFRRRRAR